MVVASTITRTPFPKCVTLNSREELLKACENKALVIKREFSDSTNCTYLPDANPANRVKRVTQKLDQTLRLYGGIRSLPLPAWMGQPFISGLLHKGELRAFVAGGTMTHVIHTWAEESTQEFVDNITPLSRLW